VVRIKAFMMAVVDLLLVGFVVAVNDEIGRRLEGKMTTTGWSDDTREDMNGCRSISATGGVMSESPEQSTTTEASGTPLLRSSNLVG